ncbi:hypothetical protein [Chitinasiproducens palmae]|uniref:Uncharacterized protein n=1 Tax=Chitinasiproducens palmae TaxID=1770053 RepID=A0A1H2PJC5_9BURK|nr:hypothetical protein [Chitinasiproducens palmae]SDV46413.1 hypothetical protein SAMN05216551_101319 [Chitinasiproducens palmae]
MIDTPPVRPTEHEDSSVATAVRRTRRRALLGMQKIAGATVIVAGSAGLAGCQTATPLEVAIGDPQAGSRADTASQLDFRGMDQAVDDCKQAARSAAANRCAQVRAYESCMHGKGYVTLLGPDTPSGCGETDWQRNLRQEMKVLREDGR